MGDKYILAIDLGTSGSKTALVTTRGRVVDFTFQAVPLHLLPGGGAEQDPADWWAAIMATSKELLGRGLVPLEDVVAVTATTQWSGTVPVDEEGRPLMRAVIWMDSRGHDQVLKKVRGPINVAGYDPRKLVTWIRLTGGAPTLSAKDSFAHILYIKDELPDVYQKTYKFLEPKDWVNQQLTGRFAASYDSILVHWVTDNRDALNVSYNDKLFKMAGFEKEKLPELKKSVDVLGPLKKEVARELGLKEDTPVVMGSPDIPSAAVGSGAVADFQGHVYIGTSSWLCAHVPFKKTDLLHSMASVPCAVPGRYLIITEQETAGACLTYLRDNILYHKDELLREEALPDVYKIFDRLAEGVPAAATKSFSLPGCTANARRWTTTSSGAVCSTCPWKTPGPM